MVLLVWHLIGTCLLGLDAYQCIKPWPSKCQAVGGVHKGQFQYFSDYKLAEIWTETKHNTKVNGGMSVNEKVIHVQVVFTTKA